MVSPFLYGKPVDKEWGRGEKVNEMEYFDSILNLVSLIIGGGAGVLFTWRWQQKKAKAEADGAEASAAKEMQDVYQQLIEDIKADRNEQKEYIAELKEDRRHLRQDRDDLRKRQDELDEKVRHLQHEVARNNQLVEKLRPFVCADLKCPNRKLVAISDEGEIKMRKVKREK